MFHPDERVDLAALETDFDLSHYLQRVTYAGDERRNRAKTDHIPVGGHFDYWVDDELVLSKVMLLGYPRIPFSDRPVLVATEGEVNAVVDKYCGPHRHFIISVMARGGFSGGPVISEHGFLLRVLTESLTNDRQDAELGFASAISVEPIYDLLVAAGVPKPAGIDQELWDIANSQRGS